MNITITTDTDNHKRMLKERFKGFTKDRLIEVIMGEQNSRLTMAHAAYVIMHQDQFDPELVEMYEDYVEGVAEDVGVTEGGIYAL